MFSTLAKPIMISKHMYGVALTPYLPYVTLDITLIYEFRFTQIVQHFQLLMLNYHLTFVVIIFLKYSIS